MRAHSIHVIWNLTCALGVVGLCFLLNCGTALAVPAWRSAAAAAPTVNTSGQAGTVSKRCGSEMPVLGDCGKISHAADEVPVGSVDSADSDSMGEGRRYRVALEVQHGHTGLSDAMRTQVEHADVMEGRLFARVSAKNMSHVVDSAKDVSVGKPEKNTEKMKGNTEPQLDSEQQVGTVEISNFKISRWKSFLEKVIKIGGSVFMFILVAPGTFPAIACLCGFLARRMYKRDETDPSEDDNAAAQEMHELPTHTSGPPVLSQEKEGVENQLERTRYEERQNPHQHQRRVQRIPRDEWSAEDHEPSIRVRKPQITLV
ncbi:hypothetical protein FVE85_3151 [Porphyridium purpureum]|uniref:Transmembrane protein n=1 Tax=Porphyridium purpureum TaxID=35688 RepID=A0A5J4YVG3_PORPP|nr:hypothetical protein FVE85_3151 [Porphyridium purpureum]|eukprot:POR0183..scf227_4